MARKAKTETEGHGVSALRGNGFSKEMVQSFVDRVLNLHSDLDDLAGEHLTKCKRVRDDIAEVLEEAKGAGIKKKALKASIKKALLERKIESVRETLEEEDQDEFDKIEQALGKLGETPLGKAALAAAARNGSTKGATA